jgi:hypothetical protein
MKVVRKLLKAFGPAMFAMAVFNFVFHHELHRAEWTDEAFHPAIVLVEPRGGALL